jgi:3-oxoadipate enol-lactonase
MNLPRYREKGSGARPILFLHGVGADADSWSPQLDHFAARGYRAIAWNLPGYGGTPMLPDLTFAAIAEALLALLDELKIERVDLVGHSYGGMVAQEFVAAHADRLRSLALSGTSPAFGRPDGEWQQKFIRERLAPIEAGKSMADLAAGMIQSLTGRAPNPMGMAIAKRSIAQVPTDTFAAGVRLLVTFDRRDALATIRTPTLVLAGEQDSNAPAEMMQRMAGKIRKAEYVCLPAAGHLGNLENPGAYNAALERFLAAH